MTEKSECKYGECLQQIDLYAYSKGCGNCKPMKCPSPYCTAMVPEIILLCNGGHCRNCAVALFRAPRKTYINRNHRVKCFSQYCKQTLWWTEDANAQEYCMNCDEALYKINKRRRIGTSDEQHRKACGFCFAVSSEKDHTALQKLGYLSEYSVVKRERTETATTYQAYMYFKDKQCCADLKRHFQDEPKIVAAPKCNKESNKLKNGISELLDMSDIEIMAKFPRCHKAYISAKYTYLQDRLFKEMLKLYRNHDDKAEAVEKALNDIKNY